MEKSKRRKRDRRVNWEMRREMTIRKGIKESVKEKQCDEKVLKRTTETSRVEQIRRALCFAVSSSESFMSGNGLIPLPGQDWR